MSSCIVWIANGIERFQGSALPFALRIVRDRSVLGWHYEIDRFFVFPHLKSQLLIKKLNSRRKLVTNCLLSLRVSIEHIKIARPIANKPDK